jgi:hypothetical protein
LVIVEIVGWNFVMNMNTQPAAAIGKRDEWCDPNNTIGTQRKNVDQSAAAGSIFFFTNSAVHGAH